MSFFYGRFLSTNAPAATAITATPPTAQTETPVSARFFDDNFSGFLLEVDDDDDIVVVAVVEAPEDEEPVDGVARVAGVVVPPVPVPVPPGVTG